MLRSRTHAALVSSLELTLAVSFAFDPAQVARACQLLARDVEFGRRPVQVALGDEPRADRQVAFKAGDLRVALASTPSSMVASTLTSPSPASLVALDPRSEQAPGPSSPSPGTDPSPGPSKGSKGLCSAKPAEGRASPPRDFRRYGPEFHYGTMLNGDGTPATGANATIGLNSPDGTNGVQVGYNQPGTLHGKGLAFSVNSYAVPEGRLLGDLNGDGVVNILDQSRLVEIANPLYAPFSAVELLMADIAPLGSSGALSGSCCPQRYS